MNKNRMVKRGWEGDRRRNHENNPCSCQWPSGNHHAQIKRQIREHKSIQCLLQNVVKGGISNRKETNKSRHQDPGGGRKLGKIEIHITTGNMSSPKIEVLSIMSHGKVKRKPLMGRRTEVETGHSTPNTSNP